MENDVADAIETAASTNNEGKEEDSIPVELVDEVERFKDGFGDGGPRFWAYRYRYRYNNKNGLHTEKDVVEAVETAAPTDNEGKEEDSIPVELVDKEERFHAGCGDGGPRFRTYRYQYRYNNKNRLHTEKDVVEAIKTAAPTKNEGK